MSDDNVTDFATVKFGKNKNPAEHDPATALDVARAWLEVCKNEGEPVDHVIVLVGRTFDDTGSGTRYFQAGKYAYHSQIGLCTEGGLMIRGGHD